MCSAISSADFDGFKGVMEESYNACGSVGRCAEDGVLINAEGGICIELAALAEDGKFST